MNNDNDNGNDDTSEPIEPFEFDWDVDAAAAKLRNDYLNGPEHPTLPETFYAQTEELTKIRTAAHASGNPADAVLAVMAARVTLLASPKIQLPNLVGTYGSLNTSIAIAGKPGAGKSSAIGCATDLLPIPDPIAPKKGGGPGQVRPNVPGGSGEGLAEMFYAMVPDNPDKLNGKASKARFYDGALVIIDEGEAFNSMRERTGQTLGSTVRTAWSGGTIGQSNATIETNRPVTAGTYRLNIVAGFQPSNAVNLFEEIDVGTPQRFLWASAIDPTIPAPGTGPDWPGVLEVARPYTTGMRRLFQYPAHIAYEVQEERYEFMRGIRDTPTIDAHRTLMRLKLACTLSLLRSDKELHVTTRDWEMADTWLTVSDGVRDALLTLGERKKREEQNAFRQAKVSTALAVNQAQREQNDANDAARMVKCAYRIHNYVSEGRADRVSQARQLARNFRDVFNDAIDHAIEERWLIETQEEINGGLGSQRRGLKLGPVTPPPPPNPW